MTMTTYPTTPERPVTREEIDRLKRLEAEYKEALLMLNRDGYSGSEYTPGGGLLRAVEGVLASRTTMYRVNSKVIVRLHEARDADAATIAGLRHEVELQRARAEVAEAHGWHKQEAAKRYAALDAALNPEVTRKHAASESEPLVVTVAIHERLRDD